MVFLFLVNLLSVESVKLHPGGTTRGKCYPGPFGEGEVPDDPVEGDPDPETSEGEPHEDESSDGSGSGDAWKFFTPDGNVGTSTVTHVGGMVSEDGLNDGPAGRDESPPGDASSTVIVVKLVMVEEEPEVVPDTTGLLISFPECKPEASKEKPVNTAKYD